MIWSVLRPLPSAMITDSAIAVATDSELLADGAADLGIEYRVLGS